MRKIYKNSLLMLVAGTFAVSCADYNVTDDFKADPDPSIVQPYADLDAVKSYIDRAKNPNLTIGTTLSVTEFNKQELQHAAALANFDEVAFGTSLMSGKIVNEKGVMNFLDMKDLLDHVEEIGGVVYGSPIVANANQADGWIKRLTAPIEIPVDYVEGKVVDYTTMPVGTKVSNGTVEKFDGMNALTVKGGSTVNIIDGFEVDPLATYTTTFWAKSEKEDADAQFDVNFSGTPVEGAGTGGKWVLKPGKWVKISVEAKAAEGVTSGYLSLKPNRGAANNIHIQKVQVGYYPDNHRPQTEQELSDTIRYALNTWCDRLMYINEGRIKSFDLIDEPIDVKTTLDNGKYDIKHGDSDKIFWQDILGSEGYGPQVSKIAAEAFAQYEGNPSELKFFISETGLDEEKKLESLMYWINLWDANGAKIDGINAKVSITYYEDEAKQSENVKSIDDLLSNLATTGKLVRLSGFDIKYVDAEGANVTTQFITDAQRQNLANYYAYVIKQYMAKIPQDKQAGLCKSNMFDTTSDPVGLWSKNKAGDYERNAVYKAWCDALSGK